MKTTFKSSILAAVALATLALGSVAVAQPANADGLRDGGQYQQNQNFGDRGGTDRYQANDNRDNRSFSNDNRDNRVVVTDYRDGDHRDQDRPVRRDDDRNCGNGGGIDVFGITIKL